MTRCLLATTWALVTMSPSSDTTNPEPLATATSLFENIILKGQKTFAQYTGVMHEEPRVPRASHREGPSMFFLLAVKFDVNDGRCDLLHHVGDEVVLETKTVRVLLT